MAENVGFHHSFPKRTLKTGQPRLIAANVPRAPAFLKQSVRIQISCSHGEASASTVIVNRASVITHMTKMVGVLIRCRKSAVSRNRDSIQLQYTRRLIDKTHALA
jgi:hypothetical protein